MMGRMAHRDRLLVVQEKRAPGTDQTPDTFFCKITQSGAPVPREIIGDDVDVTD